MSIQDDVFKTRLSEALRERNRETPLSDMLMDAMVEYVISVVRADIPAIIVDREFREYIRKSINITIRIEPEE
jgi:2-phospho-L-lactate guanylyltransferase (CobY/MobA/RfbA family)